MKNLLFVIIAGFLNSALASGQPSGHELHFSVSHYTEDNGLPQNTVKNISADADGFIWIVTETGLVRFDGHNFFLFNKTNLSIPNSRFSMLQPNIAAGKGAEKFYAVDENYQFIRIEAGKAVLDSAYLNNSIRRIPFMNYPSKLVVLANGSPNYLRDWTDPEKYIIQLASGNGDFYVCDHRKVEYYSQWKKISEVPVPDLKYWDCITLGKNLYQYSKNGQLSQIAPTGLHACELSGDLLRDKTYNAKIKQVEVYWNNISDQVFFYFNKNLYQVKESPGNRLETVLVLENFDFAQKNISSIHFDQHNQRFFLGSITNGLFVLKRKDFVTLRTKGSNLDNVFYGQTAYDSNSILTPRGFILGRNRLGTVTINKEQTLIRAQRNIADGYGILKDRHGNIWRKSGENLYCYGIRENKLIGSWKTGDEINHLYEGRDGTIWIGTREAGLFHINILDPKPEPRLFIKGSLIRITFILQKDPGTLVVATDHGAFLLDISSKKTDLVKGTDRLYIRSLYIDQSSENNEKNIWMSTYEDGLLLYNADGLIRFPLDKNKYLAGSHCIFADKNGFFWITTNKGLFKASRKDLLNYAKVSKTGKTPDLFYLRYTKEHGFYTNEFNGGCQPCAVRLDNQYVSLPSLDGLVWFVPENASQELPSHPLLLDRYEVQGKSVWIEKDTLHFPINPQQIKIHVAMAYFGDQANVDISFALKKTGRDLEETDWLHLGSNETTISIGALSAGSYTLFVKKLNGFGTNNYTLKKITILVPPSWYETQWFQILCLLLFMAALYVFVKLRLGIIRKENRLLESKIARRTQKLEQTLEALEKSEQELQRQMHIQTRLIASMSHDIKTPLKFVSKSAGRIDVMVKNQRLDLVSELGKTIEFTTDHMYQLLENLIGYVKTQVYGSNIIMEETNLKQSLSDSIEIFKGIMRERGNEFTNEIQSDVTVHTNPQLLGIIVHNLVDNANKVCHNGLIKMYTEMREKKKHLIISDSGPGMPEDIAQWLNNPSKPASFEKSKMLSDTYSGLGLMIVKEISLLLNIKIFVEKINGTRIHLIFHGEE